MGEIAILHRANEHRLSAVKKKESIKKKVLEQ
jgi:hypothetical protein